MGAGSLTAELLYDAKAATAERPVWDDDNRRLIWVDVPVGEVHALDPERGDDTVVLASGQPVGFAALRRSGGLLVGGRDGFAMFDVAATVPTATVRIDRPNSSVRLNDGLCDAVGRAWGGTLDKQGAGGALYRVESVNGRYQLETAVRGARESNGLDWSGDGRVLYWIDTPTGRVEMFDCDVESGDLTNRRTFTSIDPREGVPDGLIVDAEDGVWVAIYGGGIVRRYDPAGDPSFEVRLPVRRPTCPTFGGTRLAQLFITTQRVNPDDPDYADDPRAGGIFVCEPGFVGRPTRAFAG